MTINSPAFLMLKHSKIKTDLEYKTLKLAIKNFNHSAKNDAEIGLSENKAEQERIETLGLHARFGRKARIMSGLAATRRREETQKLEKELVQIRVYTHGKRPRFY